MESKSPHVIFGEPDLERSHSVRTELRRRGIRVGAAGSARLLLDVASHHPPDVAVLDDRLDEMASDVLAILLRARNPNVHVVLLESEPAEGAEERGHVIDPFAVLRRPVGDALLLETVNSALHAPSAAAGEPPPSVVLCIDDDRSYLRSLVRLLRRHGYAPIPYSDPEQALEAIPVVRPSLILLDILMPGMNGLDMVEEILERYSHTVPVVLLSARDSDHTIAEGYRRGARYFITKASDPGRLLAIARYLVGTLDPEERQLLEARL